MFRLAAMQMSHAFLCSVIWSTAGSRGCVRASHLTCMSYSSRITQLEECNGLSHMHVKWVTHTLCSSRCLTVMSWKSLCHTWCYSLNESWLSSALLRSLGHVVKVPCTRSSMLSSRTRVVVPAIKLAQTLSVSLLREK